jgi:hypothetical protein
MAADPPIQTVDVDGVTHCDSYGKTACGIVTKGERHRGRTSDVSCAACRLSYTFTSTVKPPPIPWSNRLEVWGSWLIAAIVVAALIFFVMRPNDGAGCPEGQFEVCTEQGLGQPGAYVESCYCE